MDKVSGECPILEYLPEGSNYWGSTHVPSSSQHISTLKIPLLYLPAYWTSTPTIKDKVGISIVWWEEVLEELVSFVEVNRILPKSHCSQRRTALTSITITRSSLPPPHMRRQPNPPTPLQRHNPLYLRMACYSLCSCTATIIIISFLVSYLP